MNISEQIIDVINVLCEKFGIAIDWTAETILPYVEQLCVKFINFEIWTSVFWMVFWIFLAGITWLVFLPCNKAAKEVEWDFDWFSPWIATIVGVFAVLFSVIAIVNIGAQCYDIIEAITFPEKAIYDYIVSQINS